MEPRAVAEQFQTRGKIAGVRPYGSGNVNDTFLVTIEEGAESYILQRLNPAVFPEPPMVMANLRLVSEQMRKRLRQETDNGNWQLVEIVSCQNGMDWLIDAQRFCWRMLRFIDNTTAYDTVANIEQAEQIGHGLGRFHALLNDLDVASLHDTLPGFHLTPDYLLTYDLVAGRSHREDRFCREVVETGRERAAVLEDAKAQGLLPIRVIHGDPKANNFLFDDDSGQVVSIIDLDTVKPGLIHYDLGDCLRSCCNPAGEEPADLATVTFDLQRCRAICEGYLCQAASFLTDSDFLFMYDAVRLITFELGLRFYTDYLAGNVYFKARDEEHNLRRARVQFRLLACIETQEQAIRAMIRGWR